MDSQQPLASKQRTLGTGSATGHMENPRVESTCESKSDGDSSLTGAHPSTKRKWDAYVGRENEHSAARDSTSQISITTTKSDVQVINIFSSDEESQAHSEPRGKKLKQPKEKKKKKKRASAKTPSEALSQWSPVLGPSSPETIVSGLTSESFIPEPKQDSTVDPPLCEEQQRLVNTIMTGRNVFYTGSAGCGKSTVLKNFVRRLKTQLIWKGGDQKEPKRVDIIAPTGRAALDINGSTSWTYAGWNPDSMKKPLEKLKEVAENGKWIRKRLRATDVLVIDEISMMENHHLERLNEIMQSARGNTHAFGGVQLVVTGGKALSRASSRSCC
jgi:DNA replication protein DnaC